MNFVFGAVVGSLYMIKPRAADAAKTMTDAIGHAKSADEKPARGEGP